MTDTAETRIAARIAEVLRSRVKVGLKTDMGSALVFHDGLDGLASVLVRELGLTEFTAGHERWWATRIEPIE